MSLREIIRSLYAVWRVFLFDMRATQLFDDDRNRAARSFIIPILAYLIILSLGIQQKPYEGTIPFSLALLAQSLGFIITLCGYFLGVYILMSTIEKKEHFIRYVQINNWMSVILLLFSILLLFIQSIDASWGNVIFLTLGIITKLYDWFIVQTVFKVQWYWILFTLLIGEAIETIVASSIYNVIYS